MASSAPISPLRQILDDRLSELVRDVQVYVDAQTAEARDRARREIADLLNQAVRRMRQAADPEELGATLLDAAASFAGGAALFRIEGETVKGESVRGAPPEAAQQFQTLEIPLAAASALAGALESGEPVVTATTPAEVSTQLVTLLDHPPGGRASIFPVPISGRVIALLYGWGAVQGPVLEMLAQVAGSVWNGLVKPAAPELVTIAPAQPASAWDRLSPEEQQIHLRAQRFARVQVAEIRLHQAAAVRAGRARRDLYGALRHEIDTARAAFREKFFARRPSMVDYLHLELLRTLANDDSELLGKDYPGPLA